MVMGVTSTRLQQHQVGKLAWCFLLYIVLHVDAYGQNSAPLVDSMQRTTDSVTLQPMFTRLGRVSSERDVILGMIEKDSIRKVNYSQLGDLLFRATSFPALSQGSLGQWDGAEILGTLPDQQVFSHNGIPMFSVTGGSYHPLTYSPAAIERIEILAGTDAIGGLPALSIAGVNIQKIGYNTARPFTSMWYHQGAGDLVAGNVAFAQNISPSSTIAANIRRTGARGVLQSTDFDAWNVHVQGKVRTSGHAGLLFTYDISTIDVDPWGGVSSDPYGTTDLLESLAPRSTIGRESSRRHDVSAAYELRDIADSAVTITTTVYASSDHLRRVDSLWSGWYAGALSTVEATIGDVRLLGGLRFQLTDANEMRYRSESGGGSTAHTWAKAAYNVTPALSLVSSARYDGGVSGGLGYGVSMQYRDSSTVAKLDASWIDRSSTTSPEALYYAHASCYVGPLMLTMLAYHHNGMLGARINSGGMVSAQSMIGSILVRGSVFGVGRSDSTIRKPMLYTSALLAYVYSSSTSSIHLGLDYSLIGSGVLPQFNVYQRSFSDADLLQSSQQTSGLSLFARVLVGTASIRASLDNVVGTRWYTVAYMPELPRQFRLSVDWTFVD